MASLCSAMLAPPAIHQLLRRGLLVNIRQLTPQTLHRLRCCTVYLNGRHAPSTFPASATASTSAIARGMSRRRLRRGHSCRVLPRRLQRTCRVPPLMLRPSVLHRRGLHHWWGRGWRGRARVRKVGCLEREGDRIRANASHQAHLKRWDALGRGRLQTRRLSGGVRPRANGHAVGY